MRVSVHFVAVLLLCAALIGCASAPKGYIEAPDAGFTDPVGKTLEALPRTAAGFFKPRRVRFWPELAAYTVACARFDNELTNVTTVYLYPRRPDTPDKLDEHLRQIPIASPDAKLVGGRTVSIPQRTGPQVGQYRAFSYMGELNGSTQELWSGLVVASLPDRMLVVRSTSPMAQGAAAEQQILNLLSVLQWSE